MPGPPVSKKWADGERPSSPKRIPRERTPSPDPLDEPFRPTLAEKKKFYEKFNEGK